MVILIHGQSLTPHVYDFIFLYGFPTLRNTLVCINLNVSISSSATLDNFKNHLLNSASDRNIC